MPAQPKAYILLLKTHKLTVFLTASLTDTIASIKQDALSGLASSVMQTANSPPDPEWTVPQVASVKDFELCRAIRERGRPTGAYELLDPAATVKTSLTNWEVLYVQFRDSNGDLLPVQVSLPSLLDEEDEEAELAAARKGKRKAPAETE